MNSIVFQRLESLLAMKLEQLEAESGTYESQWSRWFKGAGITSGKLVQVSEKLGIEPEFLLWFIRFKQKQKLSGNFDQNIRQEPTLTALVELNNLSFLTTKKAG